MHPIGRAKNLAFSLQSLNSAHVLLAMLAVATLLQIELVFSKSINWDEFFHFSEIHRNLQDRPTSWLQVPYVWLFSWVPSIPGDAITHIQLTRLLTLPFELMAVTAIVAAAKRFASREAALFCGLLYVTGGYVFLHAFSLRGDMIAASLLMVAIWIGICRPLRVLELAVLILLVALAFVCTIKSALYAPALLGVALYRTDTAAHRWVIAALATLAVATGVILLLIAPSLPEVGVGGVMRDIGELGTRSVSRMFSAGLFPQPRWLQGQILRAPILALLVFAALATVAFHRNRSPIERVLLLSLLLPLSTVAIYRNAFPYHYTFILPPAMIAVAPTVSQLLNRYGAVPMGLLLLVISAILSISEDRTVLPRQRIIQTGIHEIFPTPVTYIDDCGIVGDFPRAINHYASGWGLSDYRQKGVPTYSNALEAEPVPLLLADSRILGTLCFDLLHRRALLPEDERTIRENYIQHWGNVFVAGKQIAAGTHMHAFHIAIPGTYTIEGGEITIDDALYPAGTAIELSRGPHIASGDRPTKVTLRWGIHLLRPQYSWPRDRVFTEF